MSANSSTDSITSGVPNHPKEEELIDEILDEPVKKTRNKNKLHKFIEEYAHQRKGAKGDIKFYYDCVAAKNCPAKARCINGLLLKVVS